MNKVKVSVPDRSWFNPKKITDPNETAGGSIRRQEPSTRISSQGCVRLGEVGKRESNDSSPQISVTIGDDHGAGYNTEEKKKGKKSKMRGLFR